MTDIDRLLELEFEKWKYHAHLRLKFSDEEEQEYSSLKKKIQGLIEKGELYETLLIPKTLFGTYSIDDIIKQNKALTEQVKKLKQNIIDLHESMDYDSDDYDLIKEKNNLKEQVKQLQEEKKNLESYYEKYCILQEHNDGFMHELEDAKSERDQLKSKMEKIKELDLCTFYNCHGKVKENLG